MNAIPVTGLALAKMDSSPKATAISIMMSGAREADRHK